MLKYSPMHFMCKIGFGAWAFSAVLALAAETPSLVVDDRTPDRVRIGVKLVSYHKTAIRGVDGELRLQYIPDRPQVQVLRARVDRTNHFYVGSLHIETIPTKLDKATHRLAMKVRFARSYAANNREVEDNLGTLQLKGLLSGADHLYVLKANQEAEFTDQQGNPILSVAAGDGIFSQPKIENSDAPIAKNLTPTKPDQAN